MNKKTLSLCDLFSQVYIYCYRIQIPGTCVCKEGFGGADCNQCAFGYFGWPNCQPCRCNQAGSRDPNSCDRACDCKVNIF